MDIKTLINKRFAFAIQKVITDKLAKNKREIANNLEISPSKFSEILNNRMNAGVDVIQRFCSKYSINYCYIFDGDEIFYESQRQKNKKKESINLQQYNIKQLPTEHYPKHYNICNFCQEKERVIKIQEKIIESYCKQIEDLREDKSLLINYIKNSQDRANKKD